MPSLLPNTASIDMITAKTAQEIHSWVRRWKHAGQRVAFVPTMGNLHQGHLELCRQAAIKADRVVVSIYVNPLQFGEGEDFDQYPRTLEQDRLLLTRESVSLLFTPTDEVIYPQGRRASTQVVVPELSDILCGSSRPGHFIGVTTVVAKLLNIVQPDVVLLGEKDFQQLYLIRRMVADLFMSPQVIGVPTVREADGLAMSSRNSYLDAEQRARAPALYRCLRRLRERLQAGERDIAALEQQGREALAEAGLRPDYVSIRKATNLASLREPDGEELVILGAAYLGETRLIDNLRVTP